MNRSVEFVKMEGAGNDFIVVDMRSHEMKDIDLQELSIRLCDRHFGIGADGLILVLPSTKADNRMRIFNPDGSEPEMCGNGIRCFAKFIWDTAKEKKDVFSVETMAGIMVPALIIKDGKAVGAEVDMGAPRLVPSDIPVAGKLAGGKDAIEKELEVAGKKIKVTALSMGNPHCVIFVDDLKDLPVAEIGPAIEDHPAFPNRTNVEFVKVMGRSEISVLVWERGVGETLACGTGACAAVVASVLTGKTDRRVIVHLPGGDLDIEWESEDDHVAMRGPARTVYKGTYSPS